MPLMSELARMDLVPMSREQLRLEKHKNWRKDGGEKCMLWVVNQSGDPFQLTAKELESLGLFHKFPAMRTHDLPIHEINKLRDAMR